MLRKALAGFLWLSVSLSAMSCEPLERERVVEPVLVTESIPLDYGELVAVTEHTELRRVALWFESGDTISAVWVRIPRHLHELAYPGKIHPQVLKVPRH